MMRLDNLGFSSHSYFWTRNFFSWIFVDSFWSMMCLMRFQETFFFIFAYKNYYYNLLKNFHHHRIVSFRDGFGFFFIFVQVNWPSLLSLSLSLFTSSWIIDRQLESCLFLFLLKKSLKKNFFHRLYNAIII